MAIDHAFPRTPPTGSGVELRTEQGLAVSATIGEVLPTSIRLETLIETPPRQPLVLRWFDSETGAWEIDIEIVRVGADGTEVRPLGEHRAAGARRALRLPAGRAAMQAEALTGIYATGLPIEMILLDSSANGIACIGWGRPPAANDIWRLELGIVKPPRFVEGRIARLVSQPFGRWLAGFEFLPRNPDELEWLLGWRDAWYALVNDD
jgi:hypothetical protein